MSYAFTMTYALTSPNMTEGASATGLPAFHAALLEKCKQYLPADLAQPDLSDDVQVVDKAGAVTRPARYGRDSAAAVAQLKFWLGYGKPRISGTAGPKLQGFLGGASRSMLMKRARAQRLRARQEGQKARALLYARQEVGKKEYPPGSNRVQFSEWYGMIGPWCAMFISWCGVKAKTDWPLRGARFAYVPYLEHAAEAHLYGLSITAHPEPGDIVTYDWDGDGVADHTGYFERWISPSQFSAIEGNTSTGNQSNGGAVMRRTDRYRSEVHRFIRVSG